VLFVSVALFVIVLTLPAIPGFFEIARPRDDGRLFIPERYVRDARWFGRTFREKLYSFVEAARRAGPSQGEMHMRMQEDVRWAPDLRIPPAERQRGIGVGNTVTVGHGAGIRDVYGLERLVVERDVVARTLTSDGTMAVAESVRILRWIDADGELTVGDGTDLGVSAAGGARVVLGRRVRFERVWGSPIASGAGEHVAFPRRSPGRSETIVDSSSTRDGGPIIVNRPARVSAGTHISGHLKVHGALHIEPGVHVEGNVIARGDITLAEGATIAGHVFAEGDVLLGPGTRVARAGVAKTVYGTGKVLVASDVEVFGWVIAESGGRTT